MDKSLLKSFISDLNKRNKDKLPLLAGLFQCCTSYEDLCYVFDNTPKIHQGLLSAPYLKRKSYNEIQKNGFSFRIQSVEHYLSIVLFLVEHNLSLFKYYQTLKSLYEKSLVLGKYNLALQYLNDIKENVGYSVWSVEQEIKLSRLMSGQNTCSNIAEKFYNFKNIIGICSPYYFKTSTIEFPFDNEVELFYKMLQNISLSKDFKDYIVSNSCSFKYQIKGVSWLDYVTNDSLIDLYNVLSKHLWEFSGFSENRELFDIYIGKLAALTGDPLFHKYMFVRGLDSFGHKQNQSRDKILLNYYQKNYKLAIQSGILFLQKYPTDFVILDYVVRAQVNGGFQLSQPFDEKSLVGLVYNHYYQLLVGKEPFFIHYKKIKTICESYYHISGFNYLYNRINSLNENSIENMYRDCYKFSNEINIFDVTVSKDSLAFYEMWNPFDEANVFKSILQGKFTTIDLDDILLNDNLLNDDKLSLIVSRWKAGCIPSYLKNVVVSFIFNSYRKKSLWPDAINYFVDNKLSDSLLEIKYDKRDLLERLENEVSDDLGMPLEMAIFYTMIDSATANRYISYKHYLKSRGVNKASEIVVRSNPKVFYFLKYVADLKTIGLHRQQFKTHEMVVEERIAICNNLFSEKPTNREIQNEIADLIKQQKVKSLIRKVDESKIYVDEDGIKQNELDDDAILFNIYKATDENVNCSDNSVKILIDIFNLDPEKLEYIQNIDGEENVNYKYTLFRQLYCDIRDHFLCNPKYGLDFYLSTRIRHGTLINQLRMHFEEHKLVTNIGEGGIYVSNTFWADDKLKLSGDERNECLKYFSEFTTKVDKVIYRIKDEYIQIKTENHNNKKLAIFDFSLDNVLFEIQMLHKTCVNVDFETCVNRIFNNLWLLTEQYLKVLSEILDKECERLVGLCVTLQKNLNKIMSDHNKFIFISSAISQCCTDLQNDFSVVKGWLQRSNTTDFDFTYQDVVDTCTTIINSMNVRKLKISVNNRSSSKFSGLYFNNLYDILHELINNVLNYQNYVNNDINCSIDVYELNNDLSINVSNSIEKSDIDLVKQKIVQAEVHLPENVIAGRASNEGNSGLSKIYNIVMNTLSDGNNEYYNYVDEDRQLMCASIKINIAKIKRYENTPN